jgi:hypothetical protein
MTCGCSRTCGTHKLAVLAIFNTHTYGFGNKFFLQWKGGLIGLLSTCCTARIVMLWWEERLIEVVSRDNVKSIRGVSQVYG